MTPPSKIFWENSGRNLRINVPERTVISKFERTYLESVNKANGAKWKKMDGLGMGARAIRY